MKIQNAINKLQKAGFIVTEDHGLFTAQKDNCRRVVEFSRNGRSDDATCIGFRYKDDRNDFQTDYCATIFCDSLAKAIRLAAA